MPHGLSGSLEPMSKFRLVLAGSVARARAALTSAGRPLFASNRRKLVTTGVALALVIVSVTAAGLAHATQQSALAAAQEADARHAKADAIAAKKAEEAAVAAEEDRARLRLARLQTTGRDLTAKAATTAAQFASFADPTALEKLDSAVSSLQAALAANNAEGLATAIDVLQAAIGSLGNLEDAQVRAFLAEPPSTGRTVLGDSTALGYAHQYCDELKTSYGPDVTGSADKIAADWGKSNADLAAIKIYCPDYLPAVDLATSRIGPGKYGVGESASRFGIAPRIVTAGTYRIPAASGCYWARSTSSGDVIDNDFISNATGPVTVTIGVGEGFETSGCPTWTRQ